MTKKRTLTRGRTRRVRMMESTEAASTISEFKLYDSGLHYLGSP